MKIYIAGSFANAEERKELLNLIDEVRKQHPGAELFIPMEHFVPGGNDKDENGNWIMPNDVWGHKVYEMDKKGLDECDEVVALYRGRISGTGTAWEIGYACGIGKKVTVYVSKKVEVASVMIMNSANIVINHSNCEQK